MKSYIEERAVDIANYTIEHKSPVRETAMKFGVSKTLVHNDLTVRLPQINSKLAKQVADVMEENFSDKHVRGGAATKERYAAR